MTNIFPIRRNQTCVYWGSPVNTGMGSFTYSDPVELTVRWQNVNQMFIDDRGKESLCKAVVFTAQDVVVDGRLKLCALADLSVAQQADPILADASTIKRVDKTPSVGKPIKYVWRVYL